MPAAVTSLWTRLRTTVAGFTVAQRTIAIIGVAVLAMGVFALASWMSRPTLTPLFSGLSASDASAVVEQLRSASVEYQLTDGGSTVLVPERAVYEQRLAAAASGLPSPESAGYSLFDTMGVTSSEFQQSVTYKRAIEGELARTIGALENISTASVQLALPEESVFVSQRIEPTASVFVETAPGADLSAEQVEAIVHLTSAAVSGMKPENVAVVDAAGRTLSAIGGAGARGTDQQAGAYETRMTASVQQMLDTVLGAGNATVSVAAEMQQATSERVDEIYTPVDGALPATEETSSETYTGTGAQPGVLGTELPAAGTGGAGTYESTQTNRSNVVNKTVESVSTPAGAVARQTVAVAVNADGTDVVDVEQLEALVTSAAGIDPARGDRVTVELVAFDDQGAAAAQAALDAAREAEEAERAAETLQTSIVAAAVVLGLVAATIAGVVVMRRRRAAADDEPMMTLTAVDEPIDRFDALTRGLATPLLDEAPTVPLPAVELDPEPDPEPVQVALDRRRAEIGDFARRDPARTADLLRRLVRDSADA
ncbi:flagellar basal-body MS-ring/collar protein FliF [Microbacterium imperiale]|uniref:Flagellar M-ring protein n=1 Tax=Microbacterium imperiale TaxID=33884 RepID=A0A9W6HHJ4_9MICO|nr:flagellar basal-body MS-ring/collar protein FliF [Microbacterium imperiale]MBP2420922.1 flagellar M-ring protein FliF [Microbacterium imperiale]MDS0199963.1 flagellar M-ring protein FliF [Microbacterium imperiale]BFE41264.1 hypothetical protein GCM10017544_22200 [Microbacterium imperiale]GLJ80215.1 hypothetical protein GCM10017586_18980 [Microbacterium imperiale]